MFYVSVVVIKYTSKSNLRKKDLFWLIVQVQFNAVNEVKIAAWSHIHSQEQCCGLNGKGHIGPCGWHY